MTDSIALVEAEVDTGDPAASSKPDRRFLDFSLNGRSLISLCAHGEYEGHISCLWIATPRQRQSP